MNSTHQLIIIALSVLTVVGVAFYKRYQTKKRDERFIQDARRVEADAHIEHLRAHYELMRANGYQMGYEEARDLRYYVHPQAPYDRLYVDYRGNLVRGNRYDDGLTTSEDYIKIPKRKLPEWM